MNARQAIAGMLLMTAFVVVSTAIVLAERPTSSLFLFLLGLGFLGAGGAAKARILLGKQAVWLCAISATTFACLLAMVIGNPLMLDFLPESGFRGVAIFFAILWFLFDVFCVTLERDGR